MSWICGQTNFTHAVDVNLLITTVPVSTVAEILAANKLVRSIQKWRHHRLKIHSFEMTDRLEMTCWSDAAWANRPNGKDSTAGVFVGISTQCLREGCEEAVTPLAWRSGKIERVCRSPAAAEAMAALNGEDDLFHLRTLWSEMAGFRLQLRHPEEAVRTSPGHPITDAKNLFDKLHTPILTIKGAEKRSDIEALSLRGNLERGHTTISWVHGDAMLSNSLTKCQEKHQAFLYVQMGHRWKVLYDEQMQSARARKKQGLSAMEGEQSQNRATTTSPINSSHLTSPINVNFSLTIITKGSLWVCALFVYVVFLLGFSIPKRGRSRIMDGSGDEGLPSFVTGVQIPEVTLCILPQSSSACIKCKRCASLL